LPQTGVPENNFSDQKAEDLPYTLAVVFNGIAIDGVEQQHPAVENAAHAVKKVRASGHGAITAKQMFGLEQRICPAITAFARRLGLVLWRCGQSVGQKNHFTMNTKG
jgi:hypothetical protein